MQKKPRSLFLILLCLFLLSTLLRFPKEMTEAAAKGLLLWFHTLLPSLFPFMVTVRLLMATDAVTDFAKLCSPVIRPVFHVSGYGAFVFIMGILSGYPMGAKLTGELLAEKKITSTEAQRLLSFTNNPGALFILATVGASLLSAPFWGWFLLICCILGAAATGILFRFYGKAEEKTALHYTRSNPLPFGTVLSASIQNAIETITMVGGFVIFFSVLVKGIELAGLFTKLPLPPSIAEGLCGGLLEMSTGCASISAGSAALPLKLSLLCLLLSFGGISILAQSVSFLDSSQLNMALFVFSKCLNGIFSSIFCFLLFPLAEMQFKKTAPVFLTLQGAVSFHFFFFLFACFLFLLHRLKRTF